MVDAGRPLHCLTLMLKANPRSTTDIHNYKNYSRVCLLLKYNAARVESLEMMGVMQSSLTCFLRVLVVTLIALLSRCLGLSVGTSELTLSCSYDVIFI